MLTGLAILERELGINAYEQHRLRRLLAQRPPKREAAGLREQLRALRTRYVEALRLLDQLHEEYDERVERAIEGMRARAARSPRTRRESPEEARRRLGLPPR